jgi:hypothetical protein
LAISHGGLLDEEIIGRVFKLATGVLINAILTQSSNGSSSSSSIAGQLHKHIFVDTSNGQVIRQGIDEMGVSTLEQV